MPGDPTQTIFHWLALGPPGLAFGLARLGVGFLYTNMLVTPTRNGRVGGLNQHDSPAQVVLRCSGI